MTKRQRKKIAKQYFKRLPNGLNYHSVRYDFEQHGWRVVLFNTENGDEIFGQLSAELLQYAKTTKAFIYAGTTARYIGVDYHLPHNERMKAMLHEAGHIELRHDLMSEARDEAAEQEAELFSQMVQKYESSLWRRHQKLLTILACCLAALLASGIVLLADYFLGLPRSVLPVSAPAGQSEQDPMVYYTSSGEKYHRKDCIFVKYKTNVTAERQSKAEEHLDPCQLCLPDQQ